MTKWAISAMWAGWISAVRQGAVVLFPDDHLGATFDALFIAGDNIQRGAVDIVAGLFAGDGGARLRPESGSCASTARERESC